MKKLIAVVMCCAMLMLGFAFAETGYSSLEELNEAAGVNLAAPGVMGVTDETYTLTDDNVAIYTFNVNGMPYELRGSSSMEDISGIEGAFTGDAAELEVFSDDTLKAARWADVSGQYILICYDEGTIEEDTFRSVAEEIADMTNPAMNDAEAAGIYEAIAGSWQDRVSQRATMEISYDGENCTAVVSWANSADSTDTWTMTLTLGEDGLLSYDDCVYTSGDEIVYENGCGSFDHNEDYTELYWSGAEDEQCAACEFEMINEG